MKKSIIITAVLFLAVVTSSFAEKKYESETGWYSHKTGKNSLDEPFGKAGIVESYTETINSNGTTTIKVNCVSVLGTCYSAEGKTLTVNTNNPPSNGIIITPDTDEMSGTTEATEN